MKQIIRPGLFSVSVSADSRRGEFDFKNQVIVENEVPVDFVFIGDSITQLWELHAYFNAPGQMVLNRGISGDTTEYVLKRFDADVVQLKPKHCVLMIGVNDAWDMETDPWLRETFMTPEEVLARAVKNHRAIQEKAKLSGIDLWVCSVCPTNMDFTNHELQRKQYIRALNAAIHQMCAENGFSYVDYYSLLVQEDGLSMRDGMTPEGLHPHVLGYNIMAEALRKALASHSVTI
ncbi:MAG: GDSL-type esterase/lipase family protein [Ruthenibacterium sp.]